MTAINLISAIDLYNLLTGRTTSVVNKLFTQEFKKAGIEITREQWSVLAVLWQSDGCSQLHIANETYRDKPSTTRLIDNLEKDAYIQRKNDPNDKRSNLIFLTAKGKKIEKKANAVIFDAMEEAIKGVTEKEIEGFKTTLDKVFHNISNRLK